MKKILFFIGIAPFCLLAQPAVSIDSLQNILRQKSIAKDELGQADALHQIGNAYYKQQNDHEALKYILAAQQALPEGHPILKGKILYRKAMLFNFLGKDQGQCLPILDSAYLLLKPSNDPDILAPFLQSYGAILNQNLQYKRGLDILLEAEQVCLQHPRLATTDRLLNIYSNILSASQQTGNFDQALIFARKGIETGKNSTNFELLADLHYNNALVLASLSYDQESEENYLKALELYQKANAVPGIILANLALGEYYDRQAPLKSGIKHLEAAKALATKAQDKYSVALVDKMETEHYIKLENYPKALACIDQCIQFFEQNKDPRLNLGVYYTKGKILKAMNQLDEGEIWVKKELEIAQKANSHYYLSSSYLLLSEIEKERQNFAQALTYYEQFASYKDSVFTANLEGKVAEERTRQNIETEQDARKKAELEADLLQAQSQVFSAIAGGLLLILLIGGYLFLQLRKSRRLLEARNQELSQLNATKDKFFGIIAHDLRNPLTAFQGVGEQLNFYLKKGDTAKLEKISGLIAKSATNLNGLLDNLLSWALLNRGMIPYHPEPLDLATESVANFKVHEDAAIAKNIQFENSIPANLQVNADRNALQAILRNLLGNAIKFTPRDGRVTLACVKDENQVFITVNDTGTGINPEKLEQLFTLEKRSEQGTDGEKGAGLGLILCKELVELNQGILRVFSTQGSGATFEFSLPSISTATSK